MPVNVTTMLRIHLMLTLSPTCGHVPVHEVPLHRGVAAVQGVLAGRVEVVLQQLPLLSARREHVAGRDVDLPSQKRESK